MMDHLLSVRRLIGPADARNAPRRAVALNCGMGSCSLYAEVKALDSDLSERAENS